MRKKVSNALPRIFTAISFCFVAIAAPLINSINAFAALPEGLVTNDDDDFAVVGELVTDGEVKYSRLTVNSANLYSGRMERGDIRIRNLKLSSAIVNEYHPSESASYGTLITNENEKLFHKVTSGNKTSLVYTAPTVNCSDVDDCHGLEIIFSNAAEVIRTGELLDFHVGLGSISDDASYTILEDLPETNYTALAIGYGLSDGTPDYSKNMAHLHTFYVSRHGARENYNAPMISFAAVYDLDVPFCNASGNVIWSYPYAEIAQPVYGYSDYSSMRIFVINNPSIGIYSGTPEMPGPIARDVSCNNPERDVIVHSLKTGYVIEGNYGAGPGVGINSFGTLGSQKVIDFNLTFPIVEMLAGEGGSLSATDPVVERNFGDPYVLQVTPDEGYNIKNILVGSLDSGTTIKNFTMEDFLADSATVPGSVVTLDNGIQFKYKGDGVVNVILPPQYMLGQNDVAQPNYDDFSITVAFEDEKGNSTDPAVPSTGDNPENPNTADAIYSSVMLFGGAIAAIAYRKRRQI